MTVVKAETVAVRNSEDALLVRQAVRSLSIELGFNLLEQTKIITAASELTRNMIDFAGGGVARIEVVNNGARTGLRITFEDRGPGIPDINLAMKQGYSTGKGLGLGLNGAKRLSDEFDIKSEVGKGTRVTITKWK